MQSLMGEIMKMYESDKNVSADELNETCQNENNIEKLRKRKNFALGDELDVIEIKQKKFGVDNNLKESPLNVMWKLFKRRTQLNFHFCKDCSNRLFQNWRKNLEEIENGGLRVSLDLCQKCIQKNLQLSDLCAWNGDNKKYVAKE